MTTVQSARAGEFARLLANGFRGKAKRIDDTDLPKIGHQIGVGEDEVHAFIDVETTGTGFDDKGRPKILFEPHVFYRNLDPSKRAVAVKAGLACRSWGQIPYGKASQQYDRLLKALVIDETAALKACSWGLGQVLGENFADAGFDSPQAMVVAMAEDEENHLQAAISFIKANGLDDELREHRWQAFARGYNGPGYAKNGYHIKLPASFAKWKKIRDTPWSPEAEAPPPPDIPAPKPPIPVVPVGAAPPDIEPIETTPAQPASSGLFHALVKSILEALFGRKDHGR